MFCGSKFLHAPRGYGPFFLLNFKNHEMDTSGNFFRKDNAQDEGPQNAVDSLLYRSLRILVISVALCVVALLVFKHCSGNFAIYGAS